MNPYELLGLKPSPDVAEGTRTRSAEPMMPDLTRPCAPDVATVERMSLSAFERTGLLVTVRSRLLGEDIFFASDEDAARMAPDKGVTYLPDELRILADVGEAGIRAAHRLKVRFRGMIVPHGPQGAVTTDRPIPERKRPAPEAAGGRRVEVVRDAKGHWVARRCDVPSSGRRAERRNRWESPPGSGRVAE